jgi:hypothetical protein
VTRRGASYRGQPLVALLLLIGSWVAVRAITLTFDMSASAATERPAVVAAGLANPSGMAAPAQIQLVEPRARASAYPVRIALGASPALADARPRARAPEKLATLALIPAPVTTALMAPTSAATPPPEPAPLKPSARAIFVPSVAPSRWSGDAWLLVRRGGAERSTAGFAPATYGASQAGAVIRYRLDPASDRRPSAYVRGSVALEGFREEEVALGLSARPVAGLPVVAAVEARVNRQAAGTRVRSAAFAYTELPPVKLLLGARAEIYGQAGYVGGNFATAFADGQVRADRQVVRLGDTELRAGGGVWGGAQKGASRLDIGPSATVNLPIGTSAGARLEIDWRFRVSGNAEPRSGPTLTLAAGF